MATFAFCCLCKPKKSVLKSKSILKKKGDTLQSKINKRRALCQTTFWTPRWKVYFLFCLMQTYSRNHLSYSVQQPSKSTVNSFLGGERRRKKRCIKNIWLRFITQRLMSTRRFFCRTDLPHPPSKWKQTGTTYWCGEESCSVSSQITCTAEHSLWNRKKNLLTIFALPVWIGVRPFTAINRCSQLVYKRYWSLICAVPHLKLGCLLEVLQYSIII